MKTLYKWVTITLTYTSKSSQIVASGAFEAARELERFSAPFSRIVPDLSVASDDTHEINSLAPGVAPGCR